MSRPSIFVGLPVWRGRYVAETLASILRQEGVELQVLVSIDGEDGESEAICRPFLSDSRVALVVQSARLGWVGNSNVVLEAGRLSGAEYVCIQPHDDLMELGYLATLARAAESNPAAAVTYSDIRCFGYHKTVIWQPAVTGSALQRQLTLLREHFAAVAYRGLTRGSVLRALPLIPGNDVENFGADTVWMARLARAGELLRVPEPRYRKRFHAENTHTGWGRWDRQKRMLAWSQHCIDMYKEAAAICDDASQLELVEAAARARLLQIRRFGAFGALVGDLSPQERQEMAPAFEAAKREFLNSGRFGSMRSQGPAPTSAS